MEFSGYSEIFDHYQIKNFIGEGGGGLKQEEWDQTRLFIKTLEHIKTKNPIMIELGSYEAMYSIIFNKFFQKQKRTNICVEIVKEYMDRGKQNALNSECENIYFEWLGIGRVNDALGYIPNAPTLTLFEWRDGMTKSPNTQSLEDICKAYEIEKIDMLHMDVQGSEGSVLLEIKEKNIKVDSIFVNIHCDGITNKYYGYDVYDKCKEIIESLGFTKTDFLYDSRTSGGYGDGLIAVTNTIRP